MKALNVIKRILYSSTFVFTVTVFMFIAIYSIAGPESKASPTDLDAAIQVKSIPLARFPWIMLFSLVVGALDNLLTVDRVPLALRLTAHFIGVLAAFYLIFLLVFGLGQTGHGKFSVMVVAAIVYCIVMVIVYAVRRGGLALIKKLSSTTEKDSESKKVKQSKEVKQKEEK